MEPEEIKTNQNKCRNSQDFMFYNDPGNEQILTKGENEMTSEITITYGENISARIELPDQNNLAIGAPCCGANAKATSPKDIFAASYGSCVIMSMGISAKKSGFDIVGARIAVGAVWAKDKPLLAEVNATVVLPDQLTEEQLDILRKGAHNCPIHNSLRPEVKTTLTFEVP